VFVSAVVAASFIATMGTVTPMASAQPTEPSADELQIDPANRCFHDLTPPSLVELPGGAKAVTATAVTTQCTGKAAPTNLVVCVSTPEGPGECGTEYNWEMAQVLVTASSFDGPFTAKAVGCWRNLLEQFQERCQPSGPLTVTI